MRTTFISIILFFISSFILYSQEAPKNITCNIQSTNRINEVEYNVEIEIKSDNATTISVNITDYEADFSMEQTESNLQSGIAKFTTFNLHYDSSIYIEVTATNANGTNKTKYVIPPVYYNGGTPYITDIAPATPQVEIIERGILTNNIESFIRFKVTSQGAESFSIKVTSVDLLGNTGPDVFVTKTPEETENYLLVTAIPFSNTISDGLIVFTAQNVFGEAASETLSMKTILTTNAVDNIQDKTITLYPNPVKDILNIQSSGDPIQGVFICDMTGKVVKHITTLNSNCINLSDMKSGVYFIKILYDNNRESTYKIVKK